MRRTDLAPTAWGRYLARLSSERAGAPTSVRLAGPGDRAAAAAAVARPLRAIAYEPRARVIELRVGGEGEPALSFFLDRPRQLALAEASGASELVVTDVHGLQTLICVGPDPPQLGRRRQSPAPPSLARLPRGRGSRCR